MFGLFKFRESKAREDEDRQARLLDGSGEKGKGASLGKGFAAGEGDSFDASGAPYVFGNFVDSAQVLSFERPGVGIPAPRASQRAPLNPKDIAIPGPVRAAFREGSSHVDNHVNMSA